uniref:Uncharacterized protein n=1 Tax=Oryza rufipogon TaxID=4529 RepID=A0A679BBB6_ORYRU|nr:hypothetical protein [Oryza rufipogon]BBF90029.1 hypothetical protein [Oryza rufipogon]
MDFTAAAVVFEGSSPDVEAKRSFDLGDFTGSDETAVVVGSAATEGVDAEACHRRRDEEQPRQCSVAVRCPDLVTAGRLLRSGCCCLPLGLPLLLSAPPLRLLLQLDAVGKPATCGVVVAGKPQRHRLHHCCSITLELECIVAEAAAAVPRQPAPISSRRRREASRARGHHRR